MKKRVSLNESVTPFVFDSRNVGQQTGKVMKTKPQNNYDGFLDFQDSSIEQVDTNQLFDIPEIDLAPIKNQRKQKPIKINHEVLRSMDLEAPQDEQAWKYFKMKGLKQEATKVQINSMKDFKQPNQNNRNEELPDAHLNPIQQALKQQSQAWTYFKQKKKQKDENKTFQIQKLQKFNTSQKKINLKENTKIKTELKKENYESKLKRKTISKEKRNYNKKTNIQKNRKTIYQSKITIETIKTIAGLKASNICSSYEFFNHHKMDVQQDQSSRYPQRNRLSPLKYWEGQKASYFKDKLIGIVRRRQNEMEIQQ